MKKWLAMLLALVMAVSLCACGEDPYAEFGHINQMLANGDYDGAIDAINALKNQQLGNSQDGSSQDGSSQDGSSQDGNSQGGNTTGDNDPAEPTQEEKNLLKKYATISRALGNYVKNGSISITSDDDESFGGFAALQYCYEQLQELAVIDKWLPSYEWSGSTPVERDRGKLLAGFYVVWDVALSRSIHTTDNMGNVNKSPWDSYWHYNSDGSVSMHEDHYRHYNAITYLGSASGTYANYEYDDSGRIERVWFGREGSVATIATYTYDASGALTSIHEKANAYEKDFVVVCDGNGNITQIAWKENKQEIKILYTYDTAGRLIREEMQCYTLSHWSEKMLLDRVCTIDYTYDSQGFLASGVYTDRDWGQRLNRGEDGAFYDDSYLYTETVDTFTYSCDEMGRVVRWEVVPGNKYYCDGEKAGEISSKPLYVLRVFETEYGDYWKYVPVQ